MALVLVVSAIGADAAGAHALAFYLLLAAVVVTAHAALQSYGRLVELPGADRALGAARLQTTLCACALAFVLVATAVRAPGLEEGTVPPLGLSALVASFALLALHSAVRIVRR